MFSSLSVREFRIYWYGMLISLVGSWIQTMAQSWLVFQITNSAFLLGVVGFLGSIPVFFFSLFAGVLADRVNKRRVLIITQTVFMLLAFLLAVLTQFKLITASQIMVIALLNGTVMAFDAPTRQSIVVELVGKQHLFNAIALNSVAFNSSRIIGPALAGILVAVVGMSGCFYVNGISFLAVIVALFLIRTAKETVTRKKSHVLKELKEGLVFIKNNRDILILISMVGIVSLFGISYMILMPIFAEQVLKVGIKGLGVLMSSSGLGALAGALILARLGDFRYKGRLLNFSALVFSFSLIIFSLSKIYLLSLLALAFIGATGVTSIALVNTIIQTKVGDEFRGRVMSVFMLTFAGFLPFGNLIAGSMAQRLGVSICVLVSGIICFVFFGAVNIMYPRIRDIN
ncbi:MAG: MFS transporter [Candidatus Omnitrophica bacterium]|nr:MFS transporter [Candidatus Omnitrophota bacterium]